MNYLELIETTVFSRERQLLMDGDEFQLFQTFLLENYEYGDTVSCTGGCKKIRWGLLNKGKRSGIRVIYYTRAISGRLYLLLIYAKNGKDDLKEQEKTVLRSIIQKLV